MSAEAVAIIGAAALLLAVLVPLMLYLYVRLAARRLPRCAATCAPTWRRCAPTCAP